MKWDGHTHTFYCSHGSKEKTELYIERAIELGFDKYTISEHPPLPRDFLKNCPYEPAVLQTIPMNDSLLDDYIRDMHDLKQRYKDRINILVALKIDYLPGHEDWTRSLLREYGKFLDDSLLSTHFLWGEGGWRCVDLSEDDLDEGLVKFHGGFSAFQEAYYAVVKQSMVADIGPHKPERIGHITLCNKFQHHFSDSPSSNSPTINGVLNMVRDYGYSLDANMAGLFKEYCREPYLPPWMWGLIRSKGIVTVYGSDAHSVKDLGRGYDTFKRLLREN